MTLQHFIAGAVSACIGAVVAFGLYVLSEVGRK